MTPIIKISFTQYIHYKEDNETSDIAGGKYMYTIETTKAHKDQLNHDDGHNNDFDFILSCCYRPKF